MKSWRPLTWVILVVNVLFVVWIIAGVGGMSDTCPSEGEYGYSDSGACEAGAAIGAGLALGMIVFFWAAVDVILGVIWLITNRNKRTCPACGNNVKKGVTACTSCGYNFAMAAGYYAPPPPPPPPPGQGR